MFAYKSKRHIYMTTAKRIEAFSSLGHKIENLASDDLQNLVNRAQIQNQWFNHDNIKLAFDGIAYMLRKEHLKRWLSNYRLEPPKNPKVVGLIMAGNIPLVGFHDLMSTVLTGHIAAVKMSSSDQVLMKWIIDQMLEIDPELASQIDIREKLTDVEALIGTGSDNTARYLEYYFRHVPRIIRKNRTSIGVLNGKESKDQLSELGKDIFWYFGLGCRNVSKLLVPKGYDPTTFFEQVEGFNYLANHHKYRNNYDYHKSIFLVNKEKHLDNGFLLWRPSEELVSPISVLFVQEYSEQDEVTNYLKIHEEKLQCIVGDGHIPFGQAQRPNAWDYADRVDTVEFLQALK